MFVPSLQRMPPCVLVCLIALQQVLAVSTVAAETSNVETFNAQNDGAVRDDSVAEVFQWLSKMERALLQAHYEGVLVFRTDDKESKIFVREAWFEGQRFLRMRQQDTVRGYQEGELVQPEIIWRGKQIIRLYPQFEAEGFRQVSESGGGHLSRMANKIQDLAKYYRVRRVSGDRVAGRSTVAIDLRARDVHRFHHKFWLDEQTALLLRSSVYDADDTILEQLEFLSFNPEVTLRPSDFEPPAAAEPLFAGSADRLEDVPVTTVQWRLGWVPPGFVPLQHRMRNLRVQSPNLESVLFSDGLAAFTIFVERHRLGSSAAEVVSPVLLPTVRQGATVAHSRFFAPPVPALQRTLVATVVGDIPAKSAQRILKSFRDASEP
jgi:sigma-E factor negative regulatory protein RseB